MRTVHFCAVAILSIVTPAVHADDRAAAEQLLATYEKTQSRLTSFHIECFTKEWNGEMPPAAAEKDALAASRVQKTTIFRDDFPWRIALVHPKPKSGAPLGAARVSGIEYRFDDFLGARQGLHVQWASNDDNEPPAPDFVGVRLFGAQAGDDHGRYLNSFGFVFGRTPCDAQEYLWTLMREATSLELSPDVELVAGHKTRVLKSTGRFGEHNVWLDPEFGFLPRQVVINKQSGHLFNAIQLGVEQDPSARVPAGARLPPGTKIQPKYTIEKSESRLDNIDLAKSADRFVITGFDYVQKQTFKFADRVEQKKLKIEYRAQIVDFQADAWSPKAFETTVAIPNGTPVGSPDPGQTFVWMDGRIE